MANEAGGAGIRPGDQGGHSGNAQGQGVAPGPDPRGDAGGRSELEIDIDDAGSRPVEPAFVVTHKRPTSNPLMEAIQLPARTLAPPLPTAAPRPAGVVLEPTPQQAQKAKERIDQLVKEAKAEHGNAAASLWFEAGRIYEHDLHSLRDAAAHYQEAHKADPTFVPVIHAASRLFAQLGKWGMVVLLIDEELKLQGAPELALLTEKARIYESKLARPEDALLLYEQVLGIDPGYPAAVDAMTRHLTQQQQWTALCEVLSRAVAATPRSELKLAWLVDMARVQEGRIGDDPAALATWEQAANFSPNRRSILENLRRLYARRGDDASLEDILVQLAEQAPSAAEATAALFERARLLSLRGEQHAAVACLEEARSRTPEDTLVLAELARIYERLDNWPKLTDVLETQARATHDRAELLALFAEAGQIADEQLQDTERAIRLYGTCVEADPTYVPALTALGRLYARTSRYVELVAVYEAQVRAAADPQQRLPLLFKQAEVIAEKLDNPDGALQRLALILEIQPGYIPALKLASSLYARQGRWADLLESYEAELRTHVDRDQAIFLLEKIATVAEDRLNEPERAIAAYKRMLENQPGYLPALRSLGRLYAKAERWADLLTVNEQEAQLITDQNHVVALMHRNGEILAKLGRFEDAIAAYRQALNLQPNYLPALKALGTMFARAGRFDDLVAMHRQEAEVARRAEQRAWLLYDVAHIHEQRLKDKTGAVAAYEEVLKEDPTFHPAIRALARIHSKANAWEALIGVYRAELHVLSDVRDRALLLCRIADVLDRLLSRPAEAVDVYEEALREAPSLLLAHERLTALHARTGNAAKEAQARERLFKVQPDADSRHANLRVLCDLYLHRLDDAGRAMDAARRLLAERPDDRSALRQALVCALQLKDFRAAIDTATRLAHVEPQPAEAANLHLQIAAWRDGHVDPPDDALPDFIRVLEFEPQNPTALRAVERAYVERGAWEGLFLLYERMRQATDSPPLVADLSMKLGELAFERLDRVEAAVDAYETVLRMTPGNIAAITRLKDLYARLQRPDAQLRMLSLEALSSKDPAHAIATLLEVGALQRDRHGNVDAAADCFFRVLERDPLHPVAYTSLETLLVANSRWELLARLYTYRADAVSETPQRVELLLKAAHLLMERLKKPDIAAEAYDRVLTLIPNHPAALQQAGNLRYALGHWEQAVAAYSVLVQVAGDPVMLTPVHFNLGVIFTAHLPDAQRAVQHLTACLAMNPENREARKRLASAYALGGSPAQALSTYKQLLESATDTAEKRELHLTVARLIDTVFQDQAQVSFHLDAALQLTANPAEQQALLDEVTALYERTGNVAGLVESGLKQADQLAQSDPQRAAELCLRSARIALDKLKDVDAAVRACRRGLEIAPEHTEVRGFLADLYARSPHQALLAIEEHRRILRGGRVRAASIRALLKAWQGQRAHDRAFVAAELLSLLGVADDGEELFFTDNKKRLKKESSEALDPAQLTAWVVHPAQRNIVREILAVAGPELGKALGEELEPIDKKLVLKPKTDDMVREMCDGIGHNLGAPAFDVWRSPSRKTVDALAALPLVLVVPQEVTRTNPTRDQRFLVGRKLMALASGHFLLRGLDERGFLRLLSSLGRAVDKNFPDLGPGADEAMTKRIAAAMSRRTRGQLQEPVQQLATSPRTIDYGAYLRAVPLSENRAGLVVSSGFDAAIRIVARESNKSLAVGADALPRLIESDAQLNDLVVYALSDEHFQARQALRLAIDV